MEMNFTLRGRNLASSNASTFQLSLRRGYVCPLLSFPVTLSGVSAKIDVNLEPVALGTRMTLGLRSVISSVV